MYLRILRAHKVISRKAGNFCSIGKKTKNNLIKILMLAPTVFFFYTGHTKMSVVCERTLRRHNVKIYFVQYFLTFKMHLKFILIKDAYADESFLSLYVCYIHM